MMMMMTSLPGYNSLPALPASNYNYGARPANPEYGSGSAWKTATSIPTAYNNASQYNNAQTNQNLNQYDGRSYNPTYAPTSNSARQTNYAQTNQNLNQYDGRSYNPTYSPTSNNASQTNYAQTNQNLNQYDGRSYNPTYAPTSNNATQNTLYNNNNYLKQYLSQIDNRQLNQAQYTQNTANTANINNNLLAYYNPVTNSYNFPPIPTQPGTPYYPPVTPEPPKQDGGGFPWLPVGLGVAALAALFFFNKGGDKPHETPPVHVPPVTPPDTHVPPVTPPDTHVPPVTPPDTHVPPPTVHGTGTAGVFDDPRYYNGDRSNYFENHTTGNLTYFDDTSDDVHAEITVSKSKVEEKGTGNQLTFVQEFKFQNDGKTAKITNKEVFVGDKVYNIEGEGSADLGRDGKISWHNGTVTIETAEGKHVIKTKKFEMEANKHAYGPSYLEIDSTSTSKELDVSGVVGDGINAQLAGLGSPNKPLRSFDGFVGAKQEALTKEQMESILGQPSTRTSETSVALW